MSKYLSFFATASVLYMYDAHEGYLDVDDSDDYYDDEREEHFGIVSLALMFVALAAITAIPCLADLI